MSLEGGGVVDGGLSFVGWRGGGGGGRGGLEKGPEGVGALERGEKKNPLSCPFWGEEKEKRIVGSRI